MRNLYRWVNLVIVLVATSLCAAPVRAQDVGQSSGVQAATTPPLNPGARLRWLASRTIGPSSLAVGTVSAGWSTMFDSPEECNTHWSGFGKRYGLRLTGVATSNTLEAGLGALWGEDPRYIRHDGAPFSNRVWSVVHGAFTARDTSGRTMPAYARYIAAPCGHLLSNSWRPDSQATTVNALLRTGYAFLNRMAANAFSEFLPDLRERIR